MRRNGEFRYFSGILAEAEWVAYEHDLHIYKFRLRPWLWLLSRRTDCRIFKNKTPVEIMEAIFSKEAKSAFEDKTTTQLPKIDYCVQYRETDLDFVLRLMEKYGIYYYFRHSETKHTLVLCDSRSGHKMVEAASEPTFKEAGPKFPLLPQSNTAQRRSEHFGDWSTRRRLRTGRIQLNDYDYKDSDSDLTSRAESGFQNAKAYERYDYPGAYLTRDQGEHLARVRVEAEQARDDRRYASGEAPGLFAGALMRLAEHEIMTENVEYIVVAASHRLTQQQYRSGDGEDVSVYRSSFELQKSERQFRAPQRTARPLALGPHTAKVVGKDNKGEEGDIDVDEFGCILVRFRWDREEKSTSCRIRVAQLWSGKNWGGQIIPRIGQEVIVEFLEGDPDLPLVTGAVVNNLHMPPYELPANKTQSGLKSESTDAGGVPRTYNEIMFEDLDGREILGLRAQKDHKIEVLNVETRTIGSRFVDAEFSRKTTLEDGSDKLDIQNGKLDVTASREIIMKVGESTFRMLPNSIEITSPTITIKSVAKTEVLSDGTVIVKGGMVLIN